MKLSVCYCAACNFVKIERGTQKGRLKIFTSIYFYDIKILGSNSQ